MIDINMASQRKSWVIDNNAINNQSHCISYQNCSSREFVLLSTVRSALLMILVNKLGMQLLFIIFFMILDSSNHFKRW